jgi:hypothetical protein
MPKLNLERLIIDFNLGLPSTGLNQLRHKLILVQIDGLITGTNRTFPHLRFQIGLNIRSQVETLVVIAPLPLHRRLHRTHRQFTREGNRDHLC